MQEVKDMGANNMGSNRTRDLTKTANQNEVYYFDPRTLRNKKRIAGVCFTVAMLSHCVSCFLIYLAMTEKISYYEGVLFFIPVWIIGYWGGTFFSRVLDVKLPDGSKKCIISETTRKTLNNIVFFLGILLVAVWGYFYITHCLMVEKNTQLTNQ